MKGLKIFVLTIIFVVGLGTVSVFAANKISAEEKIENLIKCVENFEYSVLSGIEAKNPEPGVSKKIKLTNEKMAQAAAMSLLTNDSKEISSDKTESHIIFKYSIKSKALKKAGKNLFGKTVKLSYIKSDTKSGWVDVCKDTKKGYIIKKAMPKARENRRGIYPYLTTIKKNGSKYTVTKLCMMTYPAKALDDFAKYSITYTIKKSSESEYGYVITSMKVSKGEHDLSDLEYYVLMTSDEDNDQFPLAAEIRYGTDPYNPDTDGDGITDYLEYTNHKNPLDPDDAFLGDYDILNMSDLDWDGLFDYEELFEYGTDPSNPDTDEDGLSDGFEVAKGLDPLDKDTDKDGIIDGEEKIKQTYTFNAAYLSGNGEFEEWSAAVGETRTIFSREIEIPKTIGALKKGSITASVCGNLNAMLDVVNMYGQHVLLTGIRFMVGIPIEVSISRYYSDIEVEKIDKAELTLEYDETLLPEGMEDNLALCRYTDENGFEIVDGYKLDKKNNTLTCNIEIPGYYFMVNRKLME